ncbi:hypothetical protein WMO13_03575 [Ignatzschineria larvae DSM 13226]|uniref:Uncharacterized protein n=1 Tax=Ignatzschineria larvae DSM 13226 TaxID=1111732 RepID=A0ABZ3C267_9GAMM|nr:hypothetical protein [Ignatzschineria larvae]
MKKRIILLIVGLVLFLGIIGGYVFMRKNDETDVVYVVSYRYERMYCNFLVNNIPVHTSVGKDLTIQWSFMDRIGMLLKEGHNTIGIEGVDLTNADSSSFCEMSVSAYVYNPKDETVESREVTSLRLTYDKDGIFSIAESKDYNEPHLTSKPRLKNMDYAFYYKSNKDLQNNVLATRLLEIKHPFRTHTWKYKSEPFIDTLDNREKLWRKYEELAYVFKKKNYQNLVNSMMPGIVETENYQGNLIERSWEKSVLGNYVDLWGADGYDVYLKDKDHVELIISPGGELFRFRMKGDVSAISSPLTITTSLGEEYSINKTFTLVDGEIVVAY